MEDNVKESRKASDALYDSLKENGYEGLPSKDSFYETLQDSTQAAAVYQSLKDNEYEGLPDEDSFFRTLIDGYGEEKPATQAPATAETPPPSPEAVPGSDEWRALGVASPGNPYNGKTYGEVYDSVIQDYGRNLANPDIDPYAEARAQIMQAGITDDMKPDEADRLALDIREGYANRYASNGAREMVAALPDQVPNIDDLMDSQWYTRDLQGRISHEAARLGLRRENYVNYYVKPHIAKALSDRYGFDAGSAGHIAKRLLSQEEHTADQIRRREAVGIIAANAGQRIDEQFQKIQQAADEQTRAEAEGSMMTPFGSAGQSMGAAVRNWQASDPEAVWQQVKPFFDDMGSWLGIVGNQQLFEQVSQMADSENIPVNTYIDQYVLPAYADTVKREFERIAVEREMPKNTFDYVMDKVGQSLVGTVGRWMVESKARMRAQDEALQMTDAGQNTDYTPGYGARIAGGTAEMMADMALPYGGPFGLTAKIASRPVQGMAQALITDGWRPLAARMAQSSAGGSLSLGAFEGLKGAVRGGVNPEGYESVLAEDKRNAFQILSDMVEGGFVHGLPSTVTGAFMVGGPVGQRISNGRGLLGNIMGWGAQVGVDAGLATAASAAQQLPKIAAGDVTRDDLKREFYDNVGTFLALGLHSKAKEFASLAEGGRSVNGVEFTREDVDRLEDVFSKPLREIVTEIDRRQSGRGYIQKSQVDEAKEREEAVGGAATALFGNTLRSHAIPRDLKVRLCTAFNIPIPEYVMKPEVLESTDKALTQSVDLGWQEMADYEYNRPGGVADKVKAGEPLTDYDLTLRLLYQDNKQWNEVVQKVLAGDEISADEAGLLTAYNERINIIQRDYYQREKERLTAEFERENGLKKGTVDRMLEDVREGRAVEDPEALDKFNDMMREFGESLDKFKTARDEAVNTGQDQETPAEEAPNINKVPEETATKTDEVPAEETPTRIDFRLNDEVTVADDDGTITNGFVASVPAVRDGTFAIQTNDGRVIYRNAGYMQTHVTSHNGTEITANIPKPKPKTETPAKEEAQADGGIAAKYRIPLDKDGNPDYERATPEDSYDAMMEEFGEDYATALINSEISDAQKRIPKPVSAESIKIPNGLTMAEKARYVKQQIDRRKAQQEADRQATEKEQAKIDYWNSVLEVPNTRKAEADRTARREKMMTPEGREELLSEAKTAQQRAAIAKEIYGDYFNENTGEPDTVEELVSMLLPYGKLNWEGYERGINHVRGLQEELGSQHTRGLSKDKGTAGFNSYLAKKGEGESLDEVVHEMYEDSTNLIGDEHRFTTEEIKDAVIDMLLSAEKPTDIRDYIVNSRIATAEKTLRAELEREREDEETAAGKGDAGLEEPHPIGHTSTPEQIAAEEGRVNTDPTDGQKEAGNYQKGHVKIDGYDITIENPKGSIRRGTDAKGNQWETEMHNSYGYIRGTEGVDGDHIDVFLSDNPADGKVFVVDQINPETGEFDEHKVMYGFADAAEAVKAYLSNYEQGWKGLGAVTGISRDAFKEWVQSSHRKTKPFREYAIARSKGETEEARDGQLPFEAPMEEEAPFLKASPGDIPSDEIDKAMVNELDKKIKQAGIPLIDSVEEGQRTLDEYNGKDKLSASKKRAMETASVSQDEEHQHAVISFADGAKVRKNLETLAENLEKVSNQRKNFIQEVAKAIGAAREGSNSEYATFETKNGLVVTIRLADHNATVSNFDHRNEFEGISIVVSPKKSQGIINDGKAHVVEYYYDPIKLRKAEGKPLSEIVRSIEQVMYSGEYKDPTGLAEREEVNADEIRQHKVERPVFVSNAMKAVEGISQEKATPEQWLAMIRKSGGSKAGEDKWIGLSDWLKEQKGSVTKQEVMDFIRQNQIQIEEQAYREYINLDDNPKMNEFRDEFDRLVEKYDNERNAVVRESEAFNQEMYDKYGQGWANDISKLSEEDRKRYGDITNRYDFLNENDIEQLAFADMVENHGEDFSMAFEVNYGNRKLEPQMDMYGDDLSDAAKHFLEFKEQPINSTRLSYTTEGLDNKKEIALTVPTVDPYNESDEIHFGDAGEGRAVVWVRFGDTTVADKEADKKRSEAHDARISYENEMAKKYGVDQTSIPSLLMAMTKDERAKDRELADAETAAIENASKARKKVLVIDEIQSKRHQDAREKGYKIDESKSWNDSHESYKVWNDYWRELKQKYGTSDIDQMEKLASPEEMSKLEELRLDHENKNAAFIRDKKAVPGAPFEKNWHELAMKRMLRYAAENGYDKIAWTTGEQQADRYDLSHQIDEIQSIRNGGGYQVSAMKDGNAVFENWYDSESKLAEDFGKDIANKVFSNQEVGNKQSFKGLDLKVGGEGMAGFYNQILPRFMDKYGKKWGVKTGEIDLPGLEESARRMHSVDVTPEMKESVMQGQPMFFKTKDGQAYGYTYNGKIYIDPRIATAETPIHEYGHLWAEMKRQTSPKEWDRIKEVLMRDEIVKPFIEKVMRDYPELTGEGKEDALVEEVLTQFSGRHGAEKLQQMAEEIKNDLGGDATAETIAEAAVRKVKGILNDFWKGVCDMMGWQYTSAEDIADAVLRDMLNGVNPRNENRRKVAMDAVSSRGDILFQKKSSGREVSEDEAREIKSRMESEAEEERILERTEENWISEFGKEGKVMTPIGEIKMGESQYPKSGRKDRKGRFGLVKPTLERPDVIMEKYAPKEGSERDTKYLFIKSFKKADGSRIINFESVTVQQEGNEVSVSSHEIEPGKVIKELKENKMLWNRFSDGSNSLGENQGLALTQPERDPNSADSGLNPHSDGKDTKNNDTLQGKTEKSSDEAPKFQRVVSPEPEKSPFDSIMEEVERRKNAPKFQKAGDGRDPVTRILDEADDRRETARLQKAPLSEEDDVARKVYEEAVAKSTLKRQEAWQDSMVSLKKLQEAIEAETGNRAAGAEDAYAFENRMHGRAKNMGERFDTMHYRPMLRAFDELTKDRGWDNGQTMDYLISKHGLERNGYYAFRDAVREKLHDEIEEEKKKLDSDYSKKKVDEAYYAGRRAELEERERNVKAEAEEAIAGFRDTLAYKRSKEDYENGTIGYSEYLRRLEDLMRSFTTREKSRKDGEGRVVSTNYYDDHARDYSGLTETFAKEMYDEAQKTKRMAQRMHNAKVKDPDKEDELWKEYYAKMRQAYITARQLAEDAVFSGEKQDVPTPLKDTAAGRLWDRINDATKETLRISYESGMMDRSTYNKVRDMFDYYIPLRGWDENKASDVYSYIGKENVFSPAVKKTWGRTSKAENPLAYIGNIATSTILSGQRNLMKQHFLNYVMNNPTSLTSVSESWYENVGTKENPVWELRTADTAGKSADEIASIVSDFNQEMAEKQANGMAMPVRGRLRMDLNATKGQKAEHVVEVQRNGHTYQIYINGDPKAAQALNGTAAKAVSRISDTNAGKKLGELNRSMAAFFTSKNPAFVVSNLSRDLNMAGASVAVNEGAEYNARFVKNVAKVLTPRMGESSSWVKASKQPTGMMPDLMRKYKKGTLDEGDDTERYFKEFMDEGGETGFVNMLSVDSFKEKMQDEIGHMQGSNLFGRGGKECSIRKGLRLMGDTFEFYNRCAEDATRFIVYMTSREMGKTMEESIADAKDVTLNFNRKGTGGKVNAEMRDLFIFVNPAIQALANMYRMGKGHPLKLGAVATSFMAGGAFMPVLNQWLLNMFGDDDDKQAYWNLPPWVRKNNLVMWIPGTRNFLTIPLAQEFRVFYGTGEMISSAVMDHPTENMGLEVASSVADLVPINPTGNGGNLLVDFMPTGVQPLVQVGENVDFTGRPIWKENEGNKLDPMYTKAYAGTPKWMVKVSEKLNDWTGGNVGRKGVVEEKAPVWGEYINNPAVWNHLLQGYLGGMYNTIAKAFDTAYTLVKGELPDVYQVPVLNRFVNRPSERENAGLLGEEYWDLVRERDVLMNELGKNAQAAADGDAEAQKRVDEIMASDDFKRAQVIGHYKKIMDDLRKGEKAAGQMESESGARDMIRQSIGLYKQQMEEELKAVGGGTDPLEQAYKAFDAATTLTERNRFRQKIKDLSSRPKARKPADEAVEKALRYTKDEEDESREGSEKYLMEATSDDLRSDAEISLLKRQAKEAGDEATYKDLDNLQKKLGRWKNKLGEESRDYGTYSMQLIREHRQEGIDEARKALEKSADAPKDQP